MANEAVCIEAPTKFTRYTVADGTAITKYTLLKIGTDPNTAIASSGQDCFGGISMSDKVANDGQVEIGAALDGTWDLKTDASNTTLGVMVSLSGANLVTTSVAGDMLTGKIVGKALETGSASEVIRVRLGYI